MTSDGPEAARWRLAIYAEGAPDRTDLVGLLTLAAETADPDLLAFVSDVARDVLLVDGRLGGADCDWLMEACGDGRGLGSYAEFEALTSVLRHAAPAPAELVAFAAREIERAILTGERAFIGGVDGEPGQVTAGDVVALREIVHAGRPDRALAEVMFDIAHATATADNDPGFDALFAQTLRLYLVAEAPGDARFEHFWAALSEDLEPPASAAIDGLGDARYHEAAEATSTRYEAVARLPLPSTRWALAHLSRGTLSSAERRLVATLRDPAEGSARQAA